MRTTQPYPVVSGVGSGGRGSDTCENITFQ